MNNYNNNCTQKRNIEKRSRMVGKDAANSAHYKEIKNAIVECANDITSQYELSQDVCQKIIALIYEDKDAVAELPLRISFVVNALSKYGYTKKEAINIINSNFSLIKQKPLNLMHVLAITNQCGLDEELLVNNKKYSNINEKEMYALIEELKENKIELTLENILKLNSQIKSDDRMSKLIELHPLAQRTIYVYRTLYERNMNGKSLTKTK